MVKIKFKKLSKEAVIPMKAYKGDACFDLTVTSAEYDKESGVVTYGTDLAMEIPEGYVGKIYPRSSVYKRDIMLSNSVGIIDSGYRGEIKAKFRFSSHKDISAIKQSFATGESQTYKTLLYKVGERAFQMSIEKVEPIEIEEVTELSESDRGEGGYGSSGN